MFPKKLAPRVVNNNPQNPPIYSFASFLIFFVTSFSKISESSRAWTIFIMSFISLFEIVKVVFPEPCIAVIPEGAKMCFAKGTATLINGPANLLTNGPKNPPDWIILDIWALESFIYCFQMHSLS